MNRDRSYADQYRASVEARLNSVRQPRNLSEYVRWLVTEWELEIPDKLHEIDTEPESALGSPRLDGRFRAYLYGSDMATDHDDRLDASHAGAARLRPVHAALRILAGRRDQELGDRPLMARYLWRLACSGGEWEHVADLAGIPAWVSAGYTEFALRRLWAIWARDAVETAREVA